MLAALALLPGLLRAADAPLALAWPTAQGDERVLMNTQQVIGRGPLPPDLQAPLGSLWKLFVYAYLVDNQLPESGYQCQGQLRDEVYCCKTGERIERDRALVQSCGLYFEPDNLQLAHADWARYWRARQAPAWLGDLTRLQPQTRVPVSQLLEQLARLPAQDEARKVLLDVPLNAPDASALGALGGRLRVKTWSWLADDDPQSRQGGFAGWLVDGTPLWVGGSGTSMRILKDYAEVLGSLLPSPWPADAGSCVEVRLFARYPVRQVRQSGTGGSAEPGALRGRYEVEFANGNRLSIDSDGELFLEGDGEGLQLTAHLSREEYVARVLDREASAQPLEAAKALAVSIRTYLLQNASRRGDCLVIDDSSSSQRVAPRPASQGARDIAAWSADLVLAGATVTYHASQPGPDRLAWSQAVEQAAAGLRYDAILARAFPRASLSRWDKPVAACQPLPAAEQWLRKQRRDWRQTLDAEPGHEEVRQFAVCQLASGRPYVDRERQRIFVRGLFSLQDRLDLTHEYLHLAFVAHPNGQDEDYVERLARRLLLE
ncbi:DUF2300 domain-containing protein [Phytopseudomonas dryadis]|uniref:DUF2300 domain-containing protein n=1 Tax=Phytopseudomonas dryadis TaxID=2487520 RepID=A0A4Q9QXH6_9GAMM|nr:DUF2300 domain-containing protein [Pseudomonas dryadis]TBU89513.1 DUF2300 domain-containing protein [Pseudomonas dryadis]